MKERQAQAQRLAVSKEGIWREFRWDNEKDSETNNNKKKKKNRSSSHSNRNKVMILTGIPKKD